MSAASQAVTGASFDLGEQIGRLSLKDKPETMPPSLQKDTA
jgi:hypothetical protein